MFQNFGTKSGLFVAAVDRMSREVVGYLASLGERSHDVGELLSVLLAHEHQDRMHRPSAFGAMFAEAANSSEPAIRKAGRMAHFRMMRAVVELLRRGQHDGSIRDDVDAATLGWLILSQIHARQFRRARSDTSPTLERSMLDALLTALGPPPPASRRRRVDRVRRRP